MTDEELLVKIQENDLVITVNDARRLYRGCIPGWTAFAKNHGFDWKEVTRHGLLASQLMATNDAMAIEILRFKYNEQK